MLRPDYFGSYSLIGLDFEESFARHVDSNPCVSHNWQGPPPLTATINYQPTYGLVDLRST